MLESEAAVLANPKDARAWFELGLKQQENERDDQAIRALLQSISLDPTEREAYLALAVSYCNDGELKQAHNVLETWIDLVEGRPSPSQSAALENGLWQTGSEKMSRNQRHEMLTGELMNMARRRMDERGEVDADVQIALGVLFNASEVGRSWVRCWLSCSCRCAGVRQGPRLLPHRPGRSPGRLDAVQSHGRRACERRPICRGTRVLSWSSAAASWLRPRDVSW